MNKVGKLTNLKTGDIIINHHLKKNNNFKFSLYLKKLSENLLSVTNLKERRSFFNDEASELEIIGNIYEDYNNIIKSYLEKKWSN